MTTEAALSVQVRESYERFPYPAAERSERIGRDWRVFPAEWIETLIQREPGRFRKILVAGCGTGEEAFACAFWIKNAQIVAVDFSPRSLSIARKLQRKSPRTKAIRFLEADLTNPSFKKIVGGGFDFISCHGVLSYIPQPEAALRNLASCLSDNGALYLGVNGSRHFSQTWRRGLQMLGVDTARYEDGPAIRKMLKLCAALDEHSSEWRRMARPEYIAGDLLTPVLSNLPLSKWQALARRARLHFIGSREAHRTLRPLFTEDLYDLLLPRSRAEVHQLAEEIIPASFHRLIFSLSPAPNPPWRARESLEQWRISRTPLYVARWPKMKGSPTSLHNLTLKSSATNTAVDLRLPQWAIDVLHESERPQSLGTILGRTLLRVASHSLRKHLYLLYLLGAINLNPPEQ